MRVLVVGGGAREHALLWKLRQSPQVEKLYCAPGNGGTVAIAESVPIAATDIPALRDWARAHQIDLTVVGPEEPLARGLVDAFQAVGLRAFGPTQAATVIEASKVWAKEFMRRHNIPTAPFVVFDRPAPAYDYLRRATYPLVVKADGLAQGKGVTVCRTVAEAERAVQALMEERQFGEAGARIVVEACLTGREVSVFALCAGDRALEFGAACDHKPVYDNDQGPNTGGMGAYSPPGFLTPSLQQVIAERIIAPAVRGLAREGRPFCGILFAGLMVTAAGPYVLEFNARLGDPEAQVILPRLDTDLAALFHAALEGRLDPAALTIRPLAACGVVLASGGYPGPYRTGYPIQGLASLDPDILVFHAGTRRQDGQVVTAGGRVLTVVGLGTTLAEARARAYANVSRLFFPDMHYRRDIGARESVAVPT